MNEIVDAVKRVTDIMLDIAAMSKSRGIVQVSQAISEDEQGYATKTRRWSKASRRQPSREEQAARLAQAVDAFHCRILARRCDHPSFNKRRASGYFSRRRVNVRQPLSQRHRFTDRPSAFAPRERDINSRQNTYIGFACALGRRG